MAFSNEIQLQSTIIVGVTVGVKVGVTEGIGQLYTLVRRHPKESINLIAT